MLTMDNRRFSVKVTETGRVTLELTGEIPLAGHYLTRPCGVKDSIRIF